MKIDSKLRDLDGDKAEKRRSLQYVSFERGISVV